MDLKKGRYVCFVFTLGDNIVGRSEGFPPTKVDQFKVFPDTNLGFP